MRVRNAIKEGKCHGFRIWRTNSITLALTSVINIYTYLRNISIQTVQTFNENFTSFPLRDEFLFD